MVRRVNPGGRASRAIRKYKSKKQSTRMIATKALNKANRLQRSRELKRIELAAQSQTISTSGSTFELVEIGTGDTETTRDGTQIVPKTVQVNYWVEFDTNQTVPVYVRVLLYQSGKLDTSSTGLSPGDIWQETGTNLAGISLKLWQSERPVNFKVLYDRLHLLNDTSGNRVAERGKIYIPAKKLRKVTFNNAGNSREYGDISMVVISNVATNMPLFHYVSRVTFNDA